MIYWRPSLAWIPCTAHISRPPNSWDTSSTHSFQLPKYSHTHCSPIYLGALKLFLLLIASVVYNNMITFLVYKELLAKPHNSCRTFLLSGFATTPRELCGCKWLKEKFIFHVISISELFIWKKFLSLPLYELINGENLLFYLIITDRTGYCSLNFLLKAIW